MTAVAAPQPLTMCVPSPGMMLSSDENRLVMTVTPQKLICPQGSE